MVVRAFCCQHPSDVVRHHQSCLARHNTSGSVQRVHALASDPYLSLVTNQQKTRPCPRTKPPSHKRGEGGGRDSMCAAAAIPLLSLSGWQPPGTCMYSRAASNTAGTTDLKGAKQLTSPMSGYNNRGQWAVLLVGTGAHSQQSACGAHPNGKALQRHCGGTERLQTTPLIDADAACLSHDPSYR